MEETVKEVEKQLYSEITPQTDESVVETVIDVDFQSKFESILSLIDGYYTNNETRDEYPYYRVNPFKKFTPKTNKLSDILSEKMLNELHAVIPYYNQFRKWKLAYTPSVDGINMDTSFSKQNVRKAKALRLKSPSY